jgi:hypothetical protein
MATTTEHDRSDEGAGGRTAPGAEPVTGGGGDLEFDEAWADAASAGDTAAERQPRDPDPVFEDPNDR